VPLILLSFQDYVEALFLGTGPLAQSPQAGCPSGAGRMSGWPSDARVTVTLGASLSADQQKRAAAAVSQIDQATAGVVHATTRGSDDRYPFSGTSEIVILQADPASVFPCSTEALGCTLPQFVMPGIFGSVNIVMRGASFLVGHEVGHGLYGFCHLTHEAGYVSVMGSFIDTGALSEADLAASRAVYLAGLRGGATRGDFVSAGVIRP
jgi:hypothetical protein